MNAGDLIERVAFDAPTAASDGQGGMEEGWTERHACWANFKYLRGGETVQQARLSGRQPVVVTIRVCEAAQAIGRDWRMRDTRRGDIYNVNAIVQTDDRAFLEITATGGVAV
ncbi:hypothetical protein BOO69_08265 [Sulfitobacter alexandrii]|uniref:Head-tail adaptor protein n=1 Tax=Sulfitobacter alexandrii TaxID=1917485 RepID=A0A1J0WGH5_9RHOB|nr:head-tail adaptor protein [Sulfitobacter alexandrii]APE43410.1 hypothetical protein BOO69_08265 [Sulfitobacter alexandrii]